MCSLPQWIVDVSRVNDIVHVCSAGANIDSTTNKLETPLILAISWMSDPETVKILLKAGANPNLDTVDGFYPVHEASVIQNTDILETLLAADAEVDVRTKDDNMTPLHLATYSQNLNTVNLLLANGADPNAKAVKSLTPLHLAARYLGNKEMLLSLIESGTTVLLAWSPFLAMQLSSKWNI